MRVHAIPILVLGMIAVLLSPTVMPRSSHAAPKTQIGVDADAEGFQGNTQYESDGRRDQGSRASTPPSRRSRVYRQIDDPRCVAPSGAVAFGCLEPIFRTSTNVTQGGPAVSTYDLVIEARTQARFPRIPLTIKPDLRLPDNRPATIVGIPTWFWLSHSYWSPIVATATAGPLTVTITATPTSISIFPGDDNAINCHGPGTPLVDVEQAMQGSPDCGHTYRKVSTEEPNGEYTITVAISWTITWTANNGETGATEPVTQQQTFPYVVRQARAHLVE